MKHERQYTKAYGVALLAAAWLMMEVVGCASPAIPSRSVPPEPPAEAVRSDARGWWAVRFNMERPPAEIRWEKDLLIAHRIAAPILDRFPSEIDLWRFHRRSNDDAAGHQFSFLFYATPSAAERINRRVMADPLVNRLVSGGEIRAVATDAVDRIEQPAIGDTSDPSWSPVMRDNWPYFIMGVSRMWLGMIDQASRSADNRDATEVDRMMMHYRQVNEAITRVWQQESYHALLHHLNAVYGYEAMVYWEKRWKRF